MGCVALSSVKSWGNSCAVRLSTELLAVAGLKDQDKIELIAEKNTITIRKVEPLSIKEQLANYNGFYEPSEEDFAWTSMERIGKERW